MSSDQISETTKKALIIGYGSIGRRHYDVLTEHFGFKHIHLVTKQQTTSSHDYKEMPHPDRLKEYDYFLICSETIKHYEQLVYLCSHVDKKTILVEKPLFTEVQQVARNNNRIFVGYNLRFHPLLNAIRIQIGQQTVLSVNINVGQHLSDWRPDSDYEKSYSASKARGGGVLLDLSHELDYIIWLFGPFTVLASISEKISMLAGDSDDYLALIGRTNTNVNVTLNMDYLQQKPQRSITINLEHETLTADFISNSLRRKAADSDLQTKTFSVNRNSSYQAMHRHILEEGGPNACSYDDGIEVMKCVQQIRESKII